jgi:hypothetical protein
MRHKFFSIIASLAVIVGFLFTTTIAEARGGHGCHRGGGRASFGGRAGSFGGCIRTPRYGYRPICGPYRGYHPRYGYRYPGFGYGWGGTYDWGLPCYDGGSPYMCDTFRTPPPPAPLYIYQGGAVMREYGPARAPGMSPNIINEYKSSPGAKPFVRGN